MLMEQKRGLTAAEWASILHEQEQSGMSASHFCRDRGIKTSSFFSALKRHQVALSQQRGEGSLDAEQRVLPAHRLRGNVRQTTDTRQDSTASPFVALRIAESNISVASMDSSALRVQLRSGHQLWVAPGFDATHLGRLLAVLEPAS